MLTGGCPGNQGNTTVEDASTHHDRLLSSSVWCPSLQTDRLVLGRNGGKKVLEDNKEQLLFAVMIDIPRVFGEDKCTVSRLETWAADAGKTKPGIQCRMGSPSAPLLPMLSPS